MGLPLAVFGIKARRLFRVPWIARARAKTKGATPPLNGLSRSLLDTRKKCRGISETRAPKKSLSRNLMEDPPANCLRLRRWDGDTRGYAPVKLYVNVKCDIFLWETSRSADIDRSKSSKWLESLSRFHILLPSHFDFSNRSTRYYLLSINYSKFHILIDTKSISPLIIFAILAIGCRYNKFESFITRK